MRTPTAIGSSPIYLDYPSTAPIDPRVLDVVIRHWSSGFGNPHAGLHAAGWQARQAVDLARREIAQFIGARPSEIVFTSSATESNNLAILGMLLPDERAGGHAITCVTEHASVLACLDHFERLGGSVTRLPVDGRGLVNIQTLEAAFRDDTRLVSIMVANSETGVVQPTTGIAAACRARGVPYHCDAAQAVGKIPFDVASSPVSMASLSSHKMYGPVGVGVLYVRSDVQLQARLLGGGQESGLRSGTVPWPLCAGYGEAARMARVVMTNEHERLDRLAGLLAGRLTRELDGVTINGAGAPRLPGYLSVSVEGLDARSLLLSLPELALSTGSACGTAHPGPSPVLKAMGLSDGAAYGTLRIGLGRFTGESDIERAGDLLVGAVRSSLGG